LLEINGEEDAPLGDVWKSVGACPQRILMDGGCELIAVSDTGTHQRRTDNVLMSRENK